MSSNIITRPLEIGPVEDILTQPMSSQTAETNHESLYFPDGDIILRSSDEVVFKVHKLILRHGSPFFHDMFTLPQSSSEIQTIQMEESGFILGMLLGWIYPQESCQHQAIGLQDGLALLNAARKWVLKKPLRLAVTMLEDILKKEDPLRAWAISIQFDLDVARIDSAKRFIRNPTPSMPDELRNVSPNEYAELLALKESRISTMDHCMVEAPYFLALCGKHHHLFNQCLHRLVQDMEGDESLFSHTWIKKLILEWYTECRKSGCTDPWADPRDPCVNNCSPLEVAFRAERDLQAKADALLNTGHRK